MTVRRSGGRLLTVQRIAVPIPFCLALGSHVAAAEDREVPAVTSKAAAEVSVLHTDARPMVRQTVAYNLSAPRYTTAEQPTAIQSTGGDVVPVGRLTSAQLAAMHPKKDFLFVNVHIH